VARRPIIILAAAAALVAGPAGAATILGGSAPAPANLDVVSTNTGTTTPPADFVYSSDKGPVVFATALVPEPGSWAMMAVGVGMAGGVLRRRSRAIISLRR